MIGRISKAGLTAAVLITLGATAPALAQPCPDMGMMNGPMFDMMISDGNQPFGMMMPMGGRMMAHENMGMGLHPMMQVPDLSDDQRSTLTTRQRELQRELWRLQGEALDARFALEDAYKGDAPDPKAVGKAMQKVFDMHRQMVEATIAARNEARKVLTQDQLNALDKTPRPMSGAGMRGAQRQMMRP